MSLINRREFLTVVGTGTGIGIGLAAGAIILAQQNIWPFAISKAGTRSALPRAASTGRIKAYTLEAAPTTIQIGNRQVMTWAYNGGIPGPELRLTEGDTLRVTVKNRLPQGQGTSIHWHGVPLINAMDGVPGATQHPIASGQDFTYEFVAPVAGTYLYHSHVGLQLDRGLYGPLIIDPAHETLQYDQDIPLILDDWLDGMLGTPDDAMKKLLAGGDRMMMKGMSGMSPLRIPPDLLYPAYLLNGLPAEQPLEMTVKKGQRIRLRLINASAATIFHLALQGHRLTVTHTDGQPVDPVEVDAIRIGMGERYDVLVTANHLGVWQFAAQVEGAAPLTRAIFRYQGSDGPLPAATFVPPELSGRMLNYSMLKAASGLVVPPTDTPDQVVPLQLSGGNGQYVWKINGQVFEQTSPIDIQKLSLIRFQHQNSSMMPHPMHLHGHSFQLDNGTGRGPLKDTVLVDPMQSVTVNWVSDNVGTWAYHCHNVYHQEAGMMRFVKVQ